MPKPLHGSIKKNDKGDNPKRPDYRGSYTHEACPHCQAPGEDFWVSSYINTDKETGGKYLSLKMEPKIKREESHDQQQSQHNISKANGYAPDLKPVSEDIDDDLPF